MNELVFTHPLEKEPFTTNEIIAEFSGLKPRSVTDLTQQHMDSLEKFGSVQVEITPGSEHKKIWHYNEQQATLLITFMKNTAPVVEFKEALVSAFYHAKHEVAEQRVLLERNHQTNKSLGDVVKEHFPDDKYIYGNLHKLAYKVAIGQSPKQIREQRDVCNAQDALTSDELDKVEKYRRIIANYVELGFDYQQIKKRLN